jgi:hypothetical protein
VATVAERKAARRRALADACARVEARLSTYAAGAGGRYILFGSWIDGRLRYDSDLDILVAFGERGGAAWRHAELVCAEEGVRPDLHDAGTSKPAFVEHVIASGRVLP